MCVFLWFKQKRAYEMRISDWSSDVCSSDLDGDRRHRVQRGDQALLDGEVADAGQDVAAVLPVVDARPVDEDLREEVVDIDPRARRGLDDGQIGGASRRARVCQYV